MSVGSSIVKGLSKATQKSTKVGTTVATTAGGLAAGGLGGALIGSNAVDRGTTINYNITAETADEAVKIAQKMQASSGSNGGLPGETNDSQSMTSFLPWILAAAAAVVVIVLIKKKGNRRR